MHRVSDVRDAGAAQGPHTHQIANRTRFCYGFTVTTTVCWETIGPPEPPARSVAVIATCRGDVTGPLSRILDTFDVVPADTE
jgi:hypothetical protein